MRRGHTCAIEDGVGSIGVRRAGVDRHTRSADVHCVGSKAGKGGEGVGTIQGSNSNDIRIFIIRWVVRILIVVPLVIASGGHEEDTGGICSLDRVVERLGIASPAPAVTQDICTLGHGVVDPGNGIRKATTAIGVEKLECHNLHILGNAHMRTAAVGHGPDCSGAMGAVTVVIHRIS